MPNHQTGNRKHYIQTPYKQSNYVVSWFPPELLRCRRSCNGTLCVLLFYDFGFMDYDLGLRVCARVWHLCRPISLRRLCLLVCGQGFCRFECVCVFSGIARKDLKIYIVNIGSRIKLELLQVLTVLGLLGF